MKNALLYMYRPFFIAFLGVNTAILASSIIVVSIFDPSGNIGHYIGKFWSRLNLFLSGASIELRGLEHIEKGSSYVVMSNHQSHYDVWALIGYLPLQLRWVMKKELRKIPFFGLCCERMGHIYVDRSDSEKSREELQVIRDKFAAGSSVVFFPEGSRSDDGNLKPFKKGGFVMALQGQVPILPVTIQGSRFVLPKGSKKIMPGTITIYIHPPVSTSGYAYETKEALMDIVRRAIQSKIA
jgi:1-acyl-sn-glycerol-3-phosphate acyltransferase